MAMQFTKAERKKAKLRLGLTGPSGAGKTYSALLVATGLGGKIAVIDTEHGSASLYANDFEFDTLELEAPYSPERYIEAIQSAEQAGYEVLIIDSITHEWSGSGGCLAINDTIATQDFRGNTWSAWSKTTPRHQAFIEKIISSKVHIIATMRSKTETVQENKKVSKVGMKSEQRDGIEYEFTTILDINHETHLASASKDRTGLFANIDPFKINAEVGKALMNWLNTGADFYMSQENQVELNRLLNQLPEDSNAYAMVKKKYKSFAEVENAKFALTKKWLEQQIEIQKQNAATTYNENPSAEPIAESPVQAEPAEVVTEPAPKPKKELSNSKKLVSDFMKAVNVATLDQSEELTATLFAMKPEIGEANFNHLEGILDSKMNELYEATQDEPNEETV